jgi:hypothetical protein
MARNITECPIRQGVNEVIFRRLTLTNWTDAATYAWANLEQRQNNIWVDRSSVCLTTNAVTIATTNTFDLPGMLLLEEGKTYRLIVSMNIGGNTESVWGDFIGEK